MYAHRGPDYALLSSRSLPLLRDIRREPNHSSETAWRGGPDTALSAWVAEQQEVTEDAITCKSLLFLRHPDIQSDVWATPRVPSHVSGVGRRIRQNSGVIDLR